MIKSTLAAAVLVAAGFAGAANAAQDTTTFQVKITITESCDIHTTKATDVDFGSNARGKSGNIDAEGKLVVNCTLGTPYNIGLNGGMHGTGVTDRKMNNGGILIPYGLYKSAGRSDNWGDTGTGLLPGTGTGSNQDIPVYGRVVGSDTQHAPAGLYTDTITATITY